MRNSCLVFSVIILAACSSGGSSSSNSTPPPAPDTFISDPVPSSYNLTVGTYKGTSYSGLGNPTSFTQQHPQAFFPAFATPGLQIAYGESQESTIVNLAAFVTMADYMCSATPVYYDDKSNSTFLISAAHCFVKYKDVAQTLSAQNLYGLNQIKVYFGLNGKDTANVYTVKAVYLQNKYCAQAVFAEGNSCPNFVPADGGQGNDISIIQINGKFGNDSSLYPQVVEASDYPPVGAMAPILSLGFGLNTQVPSEMDKNLSRGKLFAVAGYLYYQQDALGYHYLYNSVYNLNRFGSSGYAALICGGDSGGGDLFWDGTRWILLSEHTYGPANACGTFYPYLPNAATNVSAYYAWIQMILHNSDPVSWCKANPDQCVTNG